MQQRLGNGVPRQDIKIVLARLAAFTCLALLLVVSILKVETTAEENYENYMKSFNKNYDQNEKQYRLYLKIKKEMSNHKHNADPNNDYYREINEFSDLSQQEFERLYLSLNDIRLDKDISIESLDHDFDSKLNISWIEHLPMVKDRGRCHADYAFAAVGAIEGMINIRNNCTVNHTSFSEQQIIDCCEKCSGCQGSTAVTGNTTNDIIQALRYVIEFGLERQVAYPYQNVKQDCKSNPNSERQKIGGYRLVKTFSGLLSAIKQGPVVVTVDARNWRDYAGGTYTNCGRRKNHLALLVGRTPEYFYVRNSWGRRWGERGYIRIGIGYTCGIASEAYVPEL